MIHDSSRSTRDRTGASHDGGRHDQCSGGKFARAQRVELTDSRSGFGWSEWSGCTENARSTRAERAPSRVLVEEFGLGGGIGRNPRGKRHLLKPVLARGIVALLKLGQMLGRELVTNAHKRRPQMPVHESDPGSDEPADKHVIESSQCPGDIKDLLGARM